MKNLKGLLLAVGCVAVMALSSGSVQAQGRGNFDPAQRRQFVIDRYKEQMGVTDDAEWKVLEESIGKVYDAGQEVIASRFGGFGGFRSRDRGNSSTSSSTEDSNRRRRMGPQPSPEAEDLQKAIDGKAPADEVKAKLAKLRESNAAKEAKLTAAQDDLRKLLTARQEAIAVLGGLLK